ncbi:MAG: M23 family metallopeptidase [Deltaproteobacteria bacterium]|nr:M23 family metallopeptidase [Deltaproteobacteria bacterium]
MMDMDYALNSGSGYIPQGIPCEGVITSHFGWRKISRRRARMHLGTDIAGPVGTVIYAPAAGKVSFSGTKGGYGNTVVLDHGNDLSTLYGHNSELLVKEGQWVEKGQAISKMGSTGRSTGPHLHYEVRISGKPVNPRKFF